MENYNAVKNILFLDIETVCCTPSYNNLNERLRLLWDHKARFLSEEAPADELFFERAAIYAEFGRVVSVAAGFFFEEEGQLYFKVRSFSSDNEKDLLYEFSSLLNKKYNNRNLYLCAHNGKEFDFPYLCRRMLVNNLPLPLCLDISGKKPWEVPHYDTMEMWKFGDRKSYTSLELMAALFDIPGSKSEMDGSMVSKVYYHEKDTEKIDRYCMEDVVVTAQLFLRLKNFPILPKNNIIYS